jgi:hypothetical protein
MSLSDEMEEIASFFDSPDFDGQNLLDRLDGIEQLIDGSMSSIDTQLMVTSRSWSLKRLSRMKVKPCSIQLMP